MSFLSSLNLSNNNFSGSIPQGGQLGTFDASAYWGNPYLCGRPLSPCDVRTGVHDDDDDEVEESALVDGWFYLSVGLGFAVGLPGLFAVMSIRRPWSIAYFNFVDRVIDSITKAN
ncbi:LRR receptor-like serine threonine-protein kinase [Musa troglodytarum]|uniref:LRR receptor-like serine threonine-protein kinase n=1 Tax=Musa troglodytarum TaxID=320322 RepID=A0A9E7I831_9LILI|nr:LRR receptor-like serine threonine-protein kinase [Musa troglodytarum]